MSRKKEITSDEEDQLHELIGSFLLLEDKPDLIGEVTSYLDALSAANWKKTGKSMKQLIESTKNFETANVQFDGKTIREKGFAFPTYRTEGRFRYKSNLSDDFFDFTVRFISQSTFSDDIEQFLSSFGKRNDRLIMELPSVSRFIFEAEGSNIDFDYEMFEHTKTPTDMKDSILIESINNIYRIIWIKDGVMIEMDIYTPFIYVILDYNQYTHTINFILSIDVHLRDENSYNRIDLNFPLYKFIPSQWYRALSSSLNYIKYGKK